MAAAVTTSEDSGIFWIKDLSDEEQPMVFVPGVNREGKFQTPFRPGPGSSSCASNRSIMMRENKANAHMKKKRTTLQQVQREPSSTYTNEKTVLPHNSGEATRHNPSPGTISFLPTSQKSSDNTASKVSLKDLCPEDKRRITSLIEELARVSEEKDKSDQQLRNKQETFEHKIHQLEQQNVLIMQERESGVEKLISWGELGHCHKKDTASKNTLYGLQQQYRECQELLGLYQQYLSQQKEKLNQSIAQLSRRPSHSTVSSSEGDPSGPSTSTGIDGSYLGLVSAPAGQTQIRQRDARGRGVAETSDWATIPSLSSSSEGEHTPNRVRRQRRSAQRGRSGSRSACWHACERYPGNLSGTHLHRTGPQGEDYQHGSPDVRECDRLPSGEALGPEAEGTLTAPLLGHGAWEERRHQLLLQKMQLEDERGRLQTRLAEQEESLLRQNQQLRQSRLDYSRFQQATQAELSSSIAREGPSNHPTRSSIAEVNAEERVSSKGLPHAPLNPLQNGIHPPEALVRSRKDMATSPLKAPASLSKANPVPVILSTPKARLDSSMIELLEAFSPISVSETASSACRPGHYPQPSRAALLSPGGPCPQGAQQDMEESQILEEIFFIC